ncbi:hypothetical protein SCP_0410300 [Sparassis crispa]|uniref:Uncharacterized protein n=1 Tax=Sparassis crispa TaxID=139825 RepID=A0A401GKF2_9APHY|nr:hypothetical protein SCP_0410300 [Sparassis crispa]GBE82645.1 hypothetical protein SCP_0410300 [Sparassis crispa]
MAVDDLTADTRPPKHARDSKGTAKWVRHCKHCGSPECKGRWGVTYCSILIAENAARNLNQVQDNEPGPSASRGSQTAFEEMPQ